MMYSQLREYTKGVSVDRQNCEAMLSHLRYSLSIKLAYFQIFQIKINYETRDNKHKLQANISSRCDNNNISRAHEPCICATRKLLQKQCII
jgi:hypothetical protein